VKRVDQGFRFAAITIEILSGISVRVTSFFVSLAFTLGITFGAAAESDDDLIFPENARLELVFARTATLNSGLTEGPAAAPDGSIYFSDMPFGRNDQATIHRYDPAARRTSVFTLEAGKTIGLAFDHEGQLLACDAADGGGRCIKRWDIESGTSEIVADRFDGRRLNSPNDLVVDRAGRIYFTDPRYLGDEPLELEHQAVYRIEQGSRVIEVTHAVEMPNGIALSPDGRTLYVGDHNNGGNRRLADGAAAERRAMRVYAFPLDKDGIVCGPKRTLVDFGSENGCDGIDVDSAGHIYLACRSLARPGIMVIDPAGNEIAFLPTGPEGQSGDFDSLRGIPSNMEFGSGAGAHSLYITIDKALYRVQTKQRGQSPLWATSKFGKCK
jgi:gluconolactonase